jgi:hypothetical protein
LFIISGILHPLYFLLLVIPKYLLLKLFFISSVYFFLCFWRTPIKLT